MTAYKYLRGPEPLSPGTCLAEGGEAFELAYGHVTGSGWETTDAEAYAQGYIDGIEALKIAFHARGYALGYAEGIVHWFILQSPDLEVPELVMGESGQAWVYMRGKVQAFGMGMPEERQETYAQVCKQGYADAGTRLATSPSVGQAYAYGYAQALVGHASSTLDSKFVGGHLYGLSEGLCLIEQRATNAEDTSPS